MKKIYSLLLTALILFISMKPVYAETSDIATLNASATTTSITVSGTTTENIAAVMVEILNNDESLAYYSFEVSNNKSFSGTISGLTLTEGTTYTLRVANYDGGDWKTISLTVPVTSNNNSNSSTDTTTETPKKSSTTNTNKIVTLDNGDKKQTISTTEFIITKEDGTILREITVKGNADIKISGDSKLIPTGSVMEQKELDKDSDDYKTVEKAIKDNPDYKLDEAKEVFAYDIDLSKTNGVEIHELDGYVDVSIPVPSNITISDGEHITVYRVNEDSSLTECETEVKDGVIVFKTNHFSTYIFALEEDDSASNIIVTEENVAESAEDTTVTASSTSNINLPVIIVSVVVVIGVIIAVIKIRNSK